MPWKPLPGSGDDEPARVGAPLDRVMKRLGAATAGAEQSVFDRWTELVGEQVASQATPTSLRDGVLTVTVTDPAWATQLRFLEAELVERISAHLGAAEVTRIEIRMRGRTPGRGARG